MPATMIRTTALVNALREAFPEDLGNMYTEDDGGETFDRIKQAEPIESSEEVVARKMAQIEQMKQERDGKQAEKTDTSYPADEVLDYTEEPLEGYLLAELEY